MKKKFVSYSTDLKAILLTKPAQVVTKVLTLFHIQNFISRRCLHYAQHRQLFPYSADRDPPANFEGFIEVS